MDATARRRAVLLAAGLLARASLARGDAVTDAAAARCRVDARLDGAAAMAAERHDPLDTRALRDAAEDAGAPAPAVRALVARGGEGAVASLAAAWLARQGAAPAWSRCAVARRRGVWALALVPRLAEVDGARGAVAAGATVRYRVALPEGARRATLVVRRPDGGVAHAAGAGAFRVTFDADGEYALQVVAETAQGPLPFARWRVAAGAERAVTAEAPGRDGAAEDDAPASDDDARRVFAAINRARLRAGGEALRVDPMLAELARARAAELAARGAVAHSLAPGDTPAARLAAADIAADRVAENVARARSLADAHARLDASPSHRAVRIDPTLDAVGLGVAATPDGAVYLVEIYAAHPRIAGTQR